MFATLMSEDDVLVQMIQIIMLHQNQANTMDYLQNNLNLAARAQERISASAGFL